MMLRINSSLWCEITTSKTECLNNHPHCNIYSNEEIIAKMRFWPVVKFTDKFGISMKDQDIAEGFVMNNINLLISEYEKNTGLFN